MHIINNIYILIYVCVYTQNVPELAHHLLTDDRFMELFGDNFFQ